MNENETQTQEVTETDTLEPVTDEKEEAATESKPQKPQAKVAKKPGFQMAPYYENAKVVCACGNTFTTGSTKEEIRVEICSNCHPFFTGQEKFVDTEGRVERFKRMEASKQEARPKKEEKRRDGRPKTLKEMLMSLENK